MAIEIVLRKLSEPEKNGERSILKIPIVMSELNKGPGDPFPSQRGGVTSEPYSAFRRNRLYIGTSLEQKVVSMISKPSILMRRSIYI